MKTVERIALDNKSDHDIRLDVFLLNTISSKLSGVSRTFIANLIKEFGAKVNGFEVFKPSHLLKIRDFVDFELKEIAVKNDILPFALDLDVIFENENILIINKPKNLVVHPGAGNPDSTLVNALLYYFQKNHSSLELSNVRGEERLGIVHRLDKDTTGLLIVAKNNQVHTLLGDMMKNNQIEKKYLSICYGMPVPASGVIENYIKRDESDISKMMIDIDGLSDKSKLAVTNYKTLKVFFGGAFSLVESTLLTGRTHQIRLHLSSIQKPIVGDLVYDNIKFRYYKGIQDRKLLSNLVCWSKKVKTQMLHSYSLRFKEPITGEMIDIKNYPNFMNLESML